jgi:hypothetical protein
MESTAKPEDMDVPECSICTNPITAETGHAQLACSHTFHLGCIGRWTTRGDTTCPLCRREVAPLERILAADETPSEESSDDEEPGETFLSRYLGVSPGRAQIYLDTFNGDTRAVIDYVRYVRRNANDPLYIPPLERVHRAPVLPDTDHSSEDFLRKRHWMHYSEQNYYLVDRGYLTE